MNTLRQVKTIFTISVSLVATMSILPQASIAEVRYRTGSRACGCVASTSRAWTARSEMARRLPVVMDRSNGEGLTSKIYVANELAGTVTVIDGATNKAVDTIAITYRHPGMIMAYAPHNVEAAPDGKTIWVTAPPVMLDDCECIGETGTAMGAMDDEVVVIDPRTDSIMTRIAIPGTGSAMHHLAHVVLDRESRYAYVTARMSSQVIRIDARSYQVDGRVDLGFGRGPHGIRLCGNDWLVVSNVLGKSLSIVDRVSGRAEEVHLGGTAEQTACTSDGRFAFASLSDTREVVRYELATGRLWRIPLPREAQGPAQIFMAPDDRVLYVADQGANGGGMPSNKLFLIDVAKAGVQSSIDVGWGPNGLAMNADGRVAYVSNLISGDVSVVSLTDGKVIASVPVGGGPKGVTYWHRSD